MFARIRCGRLLALASLLLGAALAGPALAMTVEPVVLDLKTPGHGMSQGVLVQNNGTYALPVELTVEELSIAADGLHPTGKDPGDLVVFPPQALIQPGQSQTFRVQYAGEPQLSHSKHYYITVAQLPLRGGRNVQPGVQVLYNLRVLVNVGPADAKPDLHVVSAAIGKDGAQEPVPVVTISNDSAAYGYLARGRLQLIERDPGGHVVLRKTLSPAQIEQAIGLGLIASGQQRRLMLPIVLPAEQGTLEALFTPFR